MIREFRTFLTATNALALAVGVIIGAAIGNVVTALTTDLLMPLISTILPSGDWRNAKWALGGTNAILYGHFAGVAVDFIIIAFVVFIVTKALLRPAPSAPTKSCPFCLETIPKEASRCRACTATL
jgi:large conductance mechanosensitive channel